MTANSRSPEQLSKEGRALWQNIAGTDNTYLQDIGKAIGDSVGTRKAKELSREENPAAKTRVAGFQRAVIAKYADYGGGSNGALYEIMRAVAGDRSAGYKGLGKNEDMLGVSTLYRVAGAPDFYAGQINDATKRLMARKAGVDETKALDATTPEFEVGYAEWTNRVGSSGKEIDSGSLNGGSTQLTWPNSWWSSQNLGIRESSKGKIAGSKDFLKMCEVLALAPEWYSGGVVQFHIKAAGMSFKRPTVFDGMMSPLWPPVGAAANDRARRDRRWKPRTAQCRPGPDQPDEEGHRPRDEQERAESPGEGERQEQHQ